ncbi:MAG: sulfotransferase [Cyanobacteria bacterium J06626_26]
MKSPILLVGLPRSGSTLVSRILNESLNCFIINDFYYLQYVESIGGYAQSNAETKALLADFILTQIRNRTRPAELEDDIIFGLPFSDIQLKEIATFIDAYKEDSEIKNWAQILQDIMQFAAKLSGKPIWGYNTPQDYLNSGRIHEHFPEAKFIFLLRSPSATLLSYKYYWTTLPKFKQDRGRYHPMIQSLAWKTCVKTYFDVREAYGQEHCMLIKFEEVLHNTDNVLAEIHQFSGMEFPHIDLKSFSNNSSLTQKPGERQTKELTGLEIKICNRLTQKEQQRLNYEQTADKDVAIADFFQLLTTTARNSAYYSSQMIFSRNVRKRVLKFVNQVTSQAGK